MGIKGLRSVGGPLCGRLSPLPAPMISSIDTQAVLRSLCVFFCQPLFRYIIPCSHFRSLPKISFFLHPETQLGPLLWLPLESPHAYVFVGPSWHELHLDLLVRVNSNLTVSSHLIKEEIFKCIYTLLLGIHPYVVILIQQTTLTT